MIGETRSAELAAVLEGAPESVRVSADAVFAASEFVSRSCERAPGLLSRLITSGDLQSSVERTAFVARAMPWLPVEQAPESELLGGLRRWRRYEMVRIAWRDLAGWASVEETLADLSSVADAAVELACARARLPLVERYGEPCDSRGEPQPLIVIGMGKLGGGELNFSSDIDLVLLFPESGETAGARPISNEEFFTRLAQGMIRLLEMPTADGFVFRVDLRLRPFGDSGAVVAGFASFEDYLLRHGRDWERYAYVKARPITGRERYAEIEASAVRPFVYRRYLDFGVFESLREMKRLIEREVARRELAEDVKLGPGGIREIEFIVQSFQLIRGGTDRRLQTPSLLEALPLLDGAKLLPANTVAELRAAYLYLRRLENCLQMVDDAQVHRLPADAPTRTRIARAMGAGSWDLLLTTLDGHRRAVSRTFAAIVFGVATDDDRRAVRIDLGRFWTAEGEEGALADALAAAGFPEAPEAARLLLELRNSSSLRRLGESGRKRLQTLLPMLLTDIASGPAPLVVLRRILRILEAIGQRSAYFSLLSESSPARQQLVSLCSHGEFLAGQIAAHPLLLDELIDERVILENPDRASLERDIELAVRRVQDEEPERQVEALRLFQRAAIFRVAVADLTGRLPVMKVSDRLTDIAELIVERAMELGWRQITSQFGVPMCDAEGGRRRAVQICAVGYGKLGGMELGYSSDLDLVFMHDSTGERQETDAERPIDNQLFFVRLAQRIMHLLTMHSAAGRLYEVDTRLRPSGKGGLLVTNMRAFADYQQTDAWTWEHQALLHARAVAGAPELRAEFERVRLEILQRHVRRETLRAEVRSMRERMRRELSRAEPGEFDIKQDAGGVADIEFLAQFWALQWAGDYPPVATFADTIRQLESVASADLVPQSTVDQLTAAYRGYRTCTHRLSLEGREGIVPLETFAAERQVVTAIWERVFAEPAQAAPQPL